VSQLLDGAVLKHPVPFGGGVGTTQLVDDRG